MFINMFEFKKGDRVRIMKVDGSLLKVSKVYGIHLGDEATILDAKNINSIKIKIDGINRPFFICDHELEKVM